MQEGREERVAFGGERRGFFYGSDGKWERRALGRVVEEEKLSWLLEREEGAGLGIARVV